MRRVSRDAALLDVTDDDLFVALKKARRHEDLGSSELHLLRKAGLIDEDINVTPAGQELHKKRWILSQVDDAKALLGKALRPLLPVQVIEQELRGFPAVSEEGLLELLQVHGAARMDLTTDELRPALRTLNSLDVLVYSRQKKTVRLGRLPGAKEAAPGEDDRIGVLVSPQTPYSNLVGLRRILRRLEGRVYWVDKHFNARALEDLVEELDSDAVDDVRIISGSAENVLSPRSLKDFRRFQIEMENKGITAEWRVADTRVEGDLHDRWLLDAKSRYNLPPVNSFYKSQYSELLQTDAEPPVERWWSDSEPHE